MTEKIKEKVAALTGNLLARKGKATPAGFTRAVPFENEPQEPRPVAVQSGGAREEDDGDQPSLDLGPAYSSKSDTAEEGWAPLSQIAIRPNPFRTDEPESAQVAEPIVPSDPPKEVGIEPTLLMDPARSLPVTPVLGEIDSDVIVETPHVPPVGYPNEPILVVPRALGKVGEGEEDDLVAPDDADGGAFEELAAPTLGGGDSTEPHLGATPVMEAGDDLDGKAKDASEDRVGESVLAAAVLSSIDEPDSPATKEPRLTETPDVVEPPVGEAEIAPRAGGDSRADGRGGGAGATPIKLPAAKPPETKSPGPRPVVAPPIRIGELQAQARVISSRSRRRGRLAPALWAVVALIVFLGVTWQVYRTNRDLEGGFVSSVGADGEPTIWATVDELGYAVSQIVSALAGGGGSGDEDDASVAAGTVDATVPTAKFVPVGPIGAESGGAGPRAEDVAVVAVETPLEAPSLPTSEPVAEIALPQPQPTPLPPVAALVVEAVPAAGPLPAPPVPAAPNGADEENISTPAAAAPVGVTAPPAPPLNTEIAAAADLAAPEIFAPEVKEEVNTAVLLEPLPPASIAVSAGADADAESGDIEPAPPTEVAALPPSRAAVPAVEAPLGVGSAGVPVLKPPAPPARQVLGARSGAEEDGPGVGGAELPDGYAVQLSSLKTRAQAEREFERLRGDYPALLRETELVVSEGSVSNRGTFFRVLTSRFENAEAARSLCRSLRDQGQDCLVVRR